MLLLDLGPSLGWQGIGGVRRVSIILDYGALVGILSSKMIAQRLAPSDEVGSVGFEEDTRRAVSLSGTTRIKISWAFPGILLRTGGIDFIGIGHYVL